MTEDNEYILLELAFCCSLRSVHRVTHCKLVTRALKLPQMQAVRLENTRGGVLENTRGGGTLLDTSALHVAASLTCVGKFLRLSACQWLLYTTV